MSVFPSIEAEKAERCNVAKACKLLEVSRSAFYDRSKHLPSARALADEALAKRIEAAHAASRRHLRPVMAPGATPTGGVRLPQAGGPHHAPAGLIGRCRRSRPRPPSPIPRSTRSTC